MRSTRLEHRLVDVSLGTRGVNGDGPFLLAHPEGLLNLERRLDRPWKPHEVNRILRQVATATEARARRRQLYGGTRGVNGDGPFLLAYPEGRLNPGGGVLTPGGATRGF